MRDASITVEVPEALLHSIQSAQIDIRELVIEAFRREVDRLEHEKPVAPSAAQPPDLRPTLAEIAAALQASEARAAAGHVSKREFGYLQGQIW
ncbi:MAG: hypothetical protein H7Y11_15770, partial [Armatimonadetes bacterium]|nr:hypothetical protein [Anaerolineae bacterium]